MTRSVGPHQENFRLDVPITEDIPTKSRCALLTRIRKTESAMPQRHRDAIGTGFAPIVYALYPNAIHDFDYEARTPTVIATSSR